MIKKRFIVFSSIFFAIASAISSYNIDAFCKEIESYHVVNIVTNENGEKTLEQEWWKKPGLYRYELESFLNNPRMKFIYLGDKTHCYRSFNEGSLWELCGENDRELPSFFKRITCISNPETEQEIKIGDNLHEINNWYEDNLLTKKTIKVTNPKGEIINSVERKVEYNKIFSPEIFRFPEEFRLPKESEYNLLGGIGIQLGSDGGLFVVLEVIEDTPADNAGFLKGDVLVKIDDKELAKCTLKDVVKLLRGPVGSIVHIEILRD